MYSHTQHKHERRHINQPLLEVTDLMLVYAKADAHYFLFTLNIHLSFLVSV